jgi:hypothetical protein
MSKKSDNCEAGDRRASEFESLSAYLRKEARINELCGSPEWTELLDQAANEIDRLGKITNMKG